MSLAISPTTALVGLQFPQQFSASGGTPPYAFSVVAGGIGGTVDPVSGLYTPPYTSGLDTVRVTDSLSAHADAVVTVATSLELFCDIIRSQMGLANDQVYLWDQKIDIPSDYRLYIAVGVNYCKPFSNTRELVPTSGGMQELLSTNVRANLSLDIFSRGPDARDRKEEVILALHSVYSEQQQEANGFYVAPLTTGFQNLSPIEGAAIPYRFHLDLNIQYQVQKVQSVPYFDTFSDAITTEP